MIIELKYMCQTVSKLDEWQPCGASGCIVLLRVDMMLLYQYGWLYLIDFLIQQCTAIIYICYIYLILDRGVALLNKGVQAWYKWCQHRPYPNIQQAIASLPVLL